MSVKRDDAREPKKVDVRVVDRRHHATREQRSVEASERSRYPSYIEELRARTTRAEEKARESIARAHAEIDAVRERLERDIDRRVAEGRARLLGAVLDIVDDLERAIGAAQNESSGLAEGVQQIHKRLLDILKKEDVEPFETLGKQFDPSLAEAIDTCPVEADRHNEVLAEFQRGYRLGDTILRPARVRVGQAVEIPPKQAAEADTKE